MTDRFDYHGWSLTNDILVLGSPSGDSQLGPTTLLLAIDDTGDPTTKDPNHPVFGLGGCAVLVGQYFETIRIPWARMKKQFFDGPLSPLHAAKLRAPSPEQISALNAFFVNAPFFRVAAMTTDRIVISDHVVRIELVCLALTRLLEQIATHVPFSKIAFVLDSSERLNPELGRVFKDLKVTQTLNGVAREIPIEFYEGKKGLCEPALEVADFVMHTAGRAVRHSLAGKPFLDLPDFRAVFATSPPELSAFIRVDGVGLEPRGITSR